MRMRCVATEINPIPLSKNGAFINIIEALRVLAKEDYEGFTPLTTFRTHNYPQPVIALTEPLLSPIKRKYVIWGLLLAWAWLSQPGRAVVTHFDLLWDDQSVGGILFGSLYLDTQEYEGEVNDTAVEDIAKPHKLEAPMGYVSSLKQIPDNVLVVSFNYFGPGVMMKENMQSSLLYVLSQAARYPADTPITDNWRPRVQENKCLFLAQRVVSASPSSFNFFWLIEATVITANYILHTGRYRNINGLILLDGHVIGNVMLFSRIHFNATPASALAAF